MAARKAYSYIRFSSAQQAKGDSLRRQTEATRAYCEQHGLVLDEAMLDLGLSAFKGTHRSEGALGAFLKAVEGGKVPTGSVLIVESLDRLSREAVFDAMSQFIAIVRAGITIVTLSDQQVYSQESVGKDFSKLLVSLSLMQRAHEESAIKSQRIGKAWEQKRKMAREAGKAMTARVPAWLETKVTKAGRAYSLIPERVKVLERIFALTIDGLGASAIAARLNREGAETWGKSHGWHASYIKKLLKNEALIGKFSPSFRDETAKRIFEEPIENYYPAAIEETLFYRAQNASASRRIGGGGRKGKSLSNLFSKLAICDCCESAMVYVDKGSTPKGGQYLVCSNAQRGMPCEVPARWRYQQVEDLILNRLRNLALDLDSQAASSQISEIQGQLDVLEAKHRAASQKRDALLSMDDGWEDPNVSAALREASETARTAETEIKRLEQELQAVVTEPQAEDRQEQVAALQARLETAADEDKFIIRSQISTAIKSLLSELRMSPTKIEAVFRDRITVRQFGTGQTVEQPGRQTLVTILSPEEAAVEEACRLQEEDWRRMSENDRIVSTKGLAAHIKAYNRKR